MANGNEATSIKQLVQGMSPEGTTLVTGTVVSADPVKVQVENDEKLTITGDVLLIPTFLTDYPVEIDTQEGEPEESYTISGDKLRTFNITGAKMTVHNALKVGDVVALLKFNGGKNYFVLDRTSWV